MGRTKKSNPRLPGRQNSFTGVKFKFLDGYEDEWKGSTDRNGFYTKVTREFLQRFGYQLEIEENPANADEDDLQCPGPIESLPSEEQEAERDRRENIYKELRKKLQNWFRHRFGTRTQNQSYVNKILDHILSMTKMRPKKRSELNVYRETCYQDRLKKLFDAQWDRVKHLLRPADRLSMSNQFVKDSWEKESEDVKKLIMDKWRKELEVSANEKKEPVFDGSVVEYERAWRTAEDILPTFADALAEWLGANITILAISPRNGEIVMQSVQSDTSKGMTKKLLPEWDPEGFRQMHEMVVKYGKAYFPPEECVRRILDETNLKKINEEDDNDGIAEDEDRAETMQGTNHVAGPETGRAVPVDFNDRSIAQAPSTSIPVTQAPAIPRSSYTHSHGSLSVPALALPAPPLGSNTYHPDPQLQPGDFGVPHGVAAPALIGQDQQFNWTVPNLTVPDLNVGIHAQSHSLLQQLNDPQLSSSWFSLLNAGSQGLAGHMDYLPVGQNPAPSLLPPSTVPVYIGPPSFHSQSLFHPSQNVVSTSSQNSQQAPYGNVASRPQENAHTPVHDGLQPLMVSLPVGDSQRILSSPVSSPPVHSPPVHSSPVPSPPVPSPPVPSPPVPLPPVPPLPIPPSPTVPSQPIPSLTVPSQPLTGFGRQLDVSLQASLPSLQIATVSQAAILQPGEKENVGDSTRENGPRKKGRPTRTKGTTNKRKAAEITGEEQPKASRKKKDTGKDQDAFGMKEPLARRPTRAVGLLEHLKGTGYVPPKKGTRTPK